MSDIIKLLPDSVANQIAAGEVIQRPASVIKELVENAVDAGARSIQIIIKDAGRTLIQVIDDGCGMSETDARMAFERHATSKITRADDLYSLHTMGFRGEALPSIAAVSQIEMRTMDAGSTLGTKLLINGSRVEGQEPVPCSRGTNIMVKNLFFNIPVRRKFLKKDSVELSNILREFERLALVNTDVELSITHNDNTLHRLLPATLKQRIIDLFGKSLERQLIPVETTTSLVTISGYIALPEYSRRRGALQYFFVNGRNMRHPYFNKAVQQCYADLIPADEQPMYFIDFKVDPDTIDVNIHPTKNEIKFENEQPIWQILTAAVKEALSRYNAVPAIDFDRDDAPDIPAFNPDSHARHDVSIDTTYNPFNAQRRANQAPSDWTKLYEEFTSKRVDNTAPHATPSQPTDIDSLLDLGTEVNPEGTLQIKNRFIVTPSREGLMVIDQHRAHVAVLYEQYIGNAGQTALQSQQVMFPETLQLSPSQSAVLETIFDDVRSLGYDVSREPDGTWTILAVPAALSEANPAETLMGMIEVVTETGEDVTADVYRRLAMSLAEAAAIRSGRQLSTGEREQLLASLLSLNNPRYTSDGRLIMATITLDELTRLFLS